MRSEFELPANCCLDAAELPLSHRPLPAEQTLAGAPHVASAQIGQIGTRAIGVWELTPSTSTDVEVDEFFIVLSGRATVEFADGRTPLELRPGVLGRLEAGTATRWIVSETLRKVYIA